MSKKEQIEEYIKDVFDNQGWLDETNNCIKLIECRSISLSELQEFSKILNVQDLEFDVSWDRYGDATGIITWKDGIKLKDDCNCADWGMMDHLSDCPAKR